MNRASILLLGGLAALAVSLLSALHALTAQPIDAQRQAAAERALLDLLPPALYDNQPLANPLPLAAGLLENPGPASSYLATLGGRPSAVLLPVSAEGYSGRISLLVAISPDGRLISSKVLQHRETAGLGELIERRRSPWLSGFDGMALSDDPARWALRDEGGAVDQISGATVTSRAVRDALQRSLRYFDSHRAQLLGGHVP